MRNNSINGRTSIRWVLILLSELLIVTHSSELKKPNIVLIVADDMGYQDVGFRESHILTPNIDRLAAEGVILENHYVLAVCAPTRTSLMTGRYPIRTGLWKGNLKVREEFGLRLDETLLPEMLKRNGYATHGIGKWHCGTYTWDHTPAKRGFDTFFGLLLGGQNYYTHRDIGNGWLDFRENYHDANGTFVDKIRDDLDGQYNTHIFSNKSIDLIQNHDTSQPLFLYLAYTAPHTPVLAPLDDIAKFTSDSIPDSRKTYAAMVSIMDDGIGKVVDALKARGMMENTILVFTSDNGARFSHQGSNFPLRGGKGSFLEGGVRGVAFVNSPLLQKSGYTNTHLYHVTDWYATFQKLADDNPEKHGKIQLPIDGVDIWRSINDDKPSREEVLLDLRDSSKYIMDNVVITSEVAETETCDKCFESTGVKFKEGFPYDAQDFIALRWKDWKLLAGSAFEFRGWSTKNRQEGYINCTDDKGSSYERTLASGTLLFDLSDDVREEKNVADQYPDIVAKLLDKRKNYLDKMMLIGNRSFFNGTMEGGIFRPWVEALDNSSPNNLAPDNASPDNSLLNNTATRLSLDFAIWFELGFELGLIGLMILLGLVPLL